MLTEVRNIIVNTQAVHRAINNYEYTTHYHIYGYCLFATSQLHSSCRPDNMNSVSIDRIDMSKSQNYAMIKDMFPERFESILGICSAKNFLWRSMSQVTKIISILLMSSN